MSFHVPVVLLALIPPLLGWQPLLLPVHIILLELIVHPVSAFTFENLPASASGPRAQASGISEAFINRGRLTRAALAGALVSLGALVIFAYLSSVSDVNTARATAFSAVLFGNLSFALSEVWPTLTGRFLATAAALAAAVVPFTFVPIRALHFSAMGIRGLCYSIIAGALGLLPFLFSRRSGHDSNQSASPE